MAILGLGPSSSKNEPVVDAPAVVPFTSGAGFFAALTTIVAGLVIVGQGLGFNVVDAPDPIKIALIGLVGAGVLAWSIAAAGDSLARAYGQAHLTRTEAGEPNEPAIQTAASRLAEAYAAAHGVKLPAPGASGCTTSATNSKTATATTPPASHSGLRVG